jgi:divalent metal cation (Fe/Co/Zn/Cd) transporter
LRIAKNPKSDRDKFEQTALKITGFSFYIFTIGLVISALLAFFQKHKPETTLWGIIISLVSIAFMWALIIGKTYVGKKLNSQAILADASCSRTCLYMAFVLLASSGIYALTHLPFIDGIGALGLATFSFFEGKECFEKAKSNRCCGCSCKH